MAPEDDVKVKQMLTSQPDATAADLERWFGLPSFTELAERPQPPPEDKELAELLERRARVSAEVDKALLEEIYTRIQVTPETLIRFEALIDVHVDPEIALFDYAMAERGHAIAEPREVEISEQLRDDLKECTPQALLRDLHRPETEFEKQFEVVDMAAAQRFDIVDEVARAMATNWSLPRLADSPVLQVRAQLADDRAFRRQPWAELKLPNRRVRE